MIDLASIYHRSGDNYCYLQNKDALHIRIRTKKANVTEIELIYGDQYEIVDYQWVSQRLSMEKSGSDSLFDYWHCTITNKKEFAMALFSEIRNSK